MIYKRDGDFMKVLSFDEFWEFVLVMWFMYRTRVHTRVDNNQSSAQKKTGADRSSEYIVNFYNAFRQVQSQDDIIRIVSIPFMTQFQFKLDKYTRDMLFPALSPQEWKCYTRIFRTDGAFSNFVHDTDKGTRIAKWASSGVLELSDLNKDTTNELSKYCINIERAHMEYLGDLKYCPDVDKQCLLSIVSNKAHRRSSGGPIEELYETDIRKIQAQRILQYVRSQLEYVDLLTQKELDESIANRLKSLTEIQQLDSAMELINLASATDARFAEKYFVLTGEFMKPKDIKPFNVLHRAIKAKVIRPIVFKPVVIKPSENKKITACFEEAIKYLPNHAAGYLLFLEYTLTKYYDKKKSEDILSKMLRNCDYSGIALLDIFALLLNSDMIRDQWPLLCDYLKSHPNTINEFVEGWGDYYRKTNIKNVEKLEVYFTSFRSDPMAVLLHARALQEVKKEKKAMQLCKKIAKVPDCLSAYYENMLLPKKRQSTRRRTKARGLG